MFNRDANYPKTQSFILFGARGVGKTTWLESTFQADETHFIDLLSAREESRLLLDPDLLENEVLALSSEKKFVVIDEIQKIPKLLDVVQRLMKKSKKIFILTGSSARKLKSKGGNLLAGRAFERFLFPLTRTELGSSFDLQTVLDWGSLPRIFSLDTHSDREEYLQTYVQTYMAQEIAAEQILRALMPFRKFLEVAAQSNGKIINFSKIARQVGKDTKTIQNYYQVLEDTLLGYFLESFHPSARVRVSKNPKFYFFDVGATRALGNLLSSSPRSGTSYYGEVFEHFIILELIRYNIYHRKNCKLYYYRTLEDQEIDLVIQRPDKTLALVEIKSTKNLAHEDALKLSRYQSHFKKSECFILSQDSQRKKIDQVSCLPYQDMVEIFSPKDS